MMRVFGYCAALMLLLAVSLLCQPEMEASTRLRPVRAGAAAGAQAPELPALAGTRHKVRVTDPDLARDVASRGGRLLADYGAYQLLDVGSEQAGALVGARDAEVRDDYNFVFLNAGYIDTASPEAAALRAPEGGFAGRRMRLVQFAGPIRPEWFDALAATGVQIVTYIPSNAYLVYGDAACLGRVQSLADSSPFVQWDGAYLDDYRVDPRALTVDAKGNARLLDTDLFAIQLVLDSEANAATLRLLEALELAPVANQFQVLNYLDVVVRVPADRLADLAARPDVVSIQPYVTPVKQDERQDQIAAGNLSGSSPSGPGYLAWLASRGFTQAQFAASGFVVDLSDSGIDNATTSPNHFGLYAGGTLGGTSRVAYARLLGTPNPNSTLQGCDGHGTLNAHIVAGYNDLSASPHVDAQGYHYGLGVAPFVRVGSSVIFDPSTFTNPNYPNLQSQAYQDGARVSSNSWGDPASHGAYSIESQAYDALVRDAQPAGSTFAAAGNQEMVIVFSAGNQGSSSGTVGSPSTGKNVISVGAAEGVQAFGGADGCGTDDAGANNANDIIGFSGRGPCTDGRRKPDLVAPGTHITGGVFQTATPGATGQAAPCYAGSGVCGGASGSPFFPTGQQFYTASSGTSHSCPAVSGAAALVRQYFINSSLAPPSPAMTKAYLMNSARYLTGAFAGDTLWSNSQGMGEMNLGTAFDAAPRILRDEVPADTFTATGQSRTFTGTIADASKPFRVTLAWTDAPGATSGNAYKNDLDLTVTVGGVTYKGNVFSGAASAAGGAADPRNNVESVFLPGSATGTFAVTVTAANINSDGVPNSGGALDQDFALVVYNGAQAAVPVAKPGSTTLVAENCAPGNGALDPGETVTVNFAISNVGSANASNVVATLQPSGGVGAPSGPQSYGALVAGGPAVSKPFTFTANGACGNTLAATLSVKDGATDLGTVTYTFILGTLGGAPVTAVYSSGTLHTRIPAVGTAGDMQDQIVGVADAGQVTDVNVRVRLNHTYDDDLTITLVGPDGTSVALSTRHGFSGDNYGSGATNCTGTFTVFDDAAASPISSAIAPFAGTFRPDSLLSVFNGKQSSGAWTLKIHDANDPDSGTLFCWQLELTRTPYLCSTCPANTPPTITASGPIARVQASAGAASQIATVGDAQTPAGNLVVTATSVPPGIAINGITNTNGTVTASVSASCAAALGANNVTLQVKDGSLATSTATLVVNVSANTLPVLGNYPNTSVAAGGSTTVTPDEVPSDNGSISTITAVATSPPGFTGSFSVDTSTGVVSVTSAAPPNVYTVTVTATDNCGATSQRTFQLTVTSNGNNLPPVANAGPDQNVNACSFVTLTGAASNDPDNGPSPLTYAWIQTAGPTVVLNGATTVSPTFESPNVATSSPLTFQLTVNDGAATNADTVVVTSNHVTGVNVDTVGLFITGGTTFFLRNCNNYGNADIAFNYGAAGFLPLRGDFDNNGTDTVGGYDPTTSCFFLRNSNSAGNADVIVCFGQPGDLPLAGDWDGNGSVTIGVYRPSTGQFLLRNSNTAGPPDVDLTFGGPNQTPIVGDWDGNGTTTIGLYIPSTGIVFLRNSNTTGPADATFQFGAGGTGVLPVVGNWDGIGGDSLGLYIQSTGVFFLRNSTTSGPADITFQFGTGGAFTPLGGNWDGF